MLVDKSGSRSGKELSCYFMALVVLVVISYAVITIRGYPCIGITVYMDIHKCGNLKACYIFKGLICYCSYYGYSYKIASYYF